jgi:GntR family transcriptional regulator, transcriptional repressor for pyruvate dehydrogenase complex
MTAQRRPTPAASIELTPLRRSSLVERVAEQLISEIEGKELPPGAKIPSERALMDALGVSRSTIREALNGLAVLGLIEIRQGQGAFVVNGQARLRRPDEIAAALASSVTKDLLEARVVIEAEIVRRAVERGTEQDMREVEAVIDKHRARLAGGRSGARYAAQFHRELGEASHNEVLASFMNSILTLMVERGTRLEALAGYAEWELAEHEGIFEAVQARDADLADRRMRQHLSAMHIYHEQLLPGADD